MKNLVFSFLILLVACAPKTVDIGKDKQEIRAAIIDWQKRSETGNIDSIMYYWADDVVILNSGRPNIKGKDSVRVLMESMMKTPGLVITWDQDPQELNVAESGELAWMILGNTMTMVDSAGNKLTARNKALEVWKKQAGEWKASVAMMVPDVAK